MKSTYSFCLLIILVTLISCKQDTTTVQNEPQPVGTQENTPPAQAPATAPAASQATSGGHDYTFLTNKLFHYKAAFAGKKAGGVEPFKDEWIDLMPDGTFKAGKLKEQTHTGLWSYNHDSKTLFLKPDDSKHKMSEWNVMHNEQMMVWVGTSTYDNQSTQVKLERSEVLPGE